VAQQPTTQLLSYSFGSDASFEGQLVGALERLESGGALRVLDALFIQSDPETRELSAISVQGDGAGSIVAPILGFRLDPAERRRIRRRRSPRAARASPRTPSGHSGRRSIPEPRSLPSSWITRGCERSRRLRRGRAARSCRASS